MTNYENNTFEEDVELLGQLAFAFRGACKMFQEHRRTLCDEAINGFMEDYEKAVNRLIKSGRWNEIPPPEDQLPDGMMPKAFFDYWRVENK